VDSRLLRVLRNVHARTILAEDLNMNKGSATRRSLRAASRRFEMTMTSLPQPMFRDEGDEDVTTVFILENDPLKGESVVARRASCLEEG
jgi:hypothetical protein